MRAILVASAAAIAIQPFVFVGSFLLSMLLAGGDIPLNELAGVSLYAALFAVPFVVLVGIPAFLLLRRFNSLSWWSLASLGFAIAALPIALQGLTIGPGYSSSGNWHGRYVNLIVDGERTLYGWLSYAQSIFFFGLHGLVGATAFLFVWRRCLGPNYSFNPKPLRSSKVRH